MPGLFVDTTVLIGATTSEDRAVKAFLEANPPAAIPNYALRELLAGYLAILCDLHNRMKVADSLPEALLGIARINSVVGRKKHTLISNFAEQFKQHHDADPQASFEDVRREMLGDLALTIGRVWKRARALTERVQPLGCFNANDLTLGPLGEVQGPGGRFGCDSKARCSAAEYVFSKDVALTNLIAALHPDQLGQALAEKNENRQRRKALKELKEKGPREFNKRGCRAIGDAYFAALCPAGYRVVTTNQVDFRPLCDAVGCGLVAPE